ncbi:MAG: hypothetical protein HUJ96_09915 [Marinilabiliaceae bacterium]|nr:hypothetical protein [Marinilabiliaceae bacterium]
MLQTIPGEHYLISNEQAEYVSKIWESNGVPTYAIYDENGNLSYKSVGLNPMELSEALQKALGE